MTGFIYAVESGGRIKLGFSEKPELRFNKIAADAPYPCQLLGYWPGSVAEELELHDKFRAIRVHGEWFAATTDLLAFIADVAVPVIKENTRFAVSETDSPLAVWRKTRRLTQAEIGERVGLSTPQICLIEAGKRKPSPLLAAKIEEMTGLDARVLLGIPARAA